MRILVGQRVCNVHTFKGPVEARQYRLACVKYF